MIPDSFVVHCWTMGLRYDQVNAYWDSLVWEARLEDGCRSHGPWEVA